MINFARRTTKIKKICWLQSISNWLANQHFLVMVSPKGGE